MFHLELAHYLPPFSTAINCIADEIPHNLNQKLLVKGLSIIVRGTNLHHLEHNLQRVIGIISNTAEMKGLKFNQSKNVLHPLL